MSKQGCGLCRIVRTVVLSIVLGGGAGFVAIVSGASPNISMLATFAGGIAPLLWLARRQRQSQREDD